MLGVEPVMRRLQLGEGVELEAHPRMTRRHHSMRDEFLRVSEMAGQAEACALYRMKVQGWSPERSMRFGAAFLQPLGEALEDLR